MKCEGDKELIQEVLFDAVVTAPLEAYWTSLVLNKSEYVTHSSQQLLDNRLINYCHPKDFAIVGYLYLAYTNWGNVFNRISPNKFVTLYRNSDKGVEIAYLGTRTGLSRINLFVLPDELTNQ